MRRGERVREGQRGTKGNTGEGGTWEKEPSVTVAKGEVGRFFKLCRSKKLWEKDYKNLKFTEKRKSGGIPKCASIPFFSWDSSKVGVELSP
jgi:hypothetical protein